MKKRWAWSEALDELVCDADSTVTVVKELVQKLIEYKNHKHH